MLLLMGVIGEVVRVVDADGVFTGEGVVSGGGCGY